MIRCGCEHVLIELDLDFDVLISVVRCIGCLVHVVNTSVWIYECQMVIYLASVT